MEKDEKYCQDCKREQCPLHCPGLVSNKPDESPQKPDASGSAAEHCSVTNWPELNKNHPEIARMLSAITKLQNLVLGTYNYHTDMIEANNILAKYK